MSDMAIHPDYPGIEVTVCVEGEPLKEYDAENDAFGHEDEAIAEHEGKCTITKYIESNTGKTFTILLSAKNLPKLGCSGIGFDVEVDGQSINYPFAFMNEARTKNGWTYHVKGPDVKAGSKIVTKSMQFAKIETSMQFHEIIFLLHFAYFELSRV
jgi:hypothetical protein